MRSNAHGFRANPVALSLRIVFEPDENGVVIRKLDGRHLVRKHLEIVGNQHVIDAERIVESPIGMRESPSLLAESVLQSARHEAVGAWGVAAISCDSEST